MYLGNGYHIDSDRYQYILEKRVLVKEGKTAGAEIGRDQSFHPTVHAACEYLLRRLQRDKLKDLGDEPEEVIEEFKRLLEDMREKFRKVEHLKLEGEDNPNNEEENDGEVR